MHYCNLKGQSHEIKVRYVWAQLIGKSFKYSSGRVSFHFINVFKLNFEVKLKILYLTHWSVAQVGSKYEKKLKVENLVGLSLYQFINSVPVHLINLTSPTSNEPSRT